MPPNKRPAIEHVLVQQHLWRLGLQNFNRFSTHEVRIIIFRGWQLVLQQDAPSFLQNLLFCNATQDHRLPLQRLLPIRLHHHQLRSLQAEGSQLVTDRSHCADWGQQIVRGTAAFLSAEVVTAENTHFALKQRTVFCFWQTSSFLFRLFSSFLWRHRWCRSATPAHIFQCQLLSILQVLFLQSFLDRSLLLLSLFWQKACSGQLLLQKLQPRHALQTFTNCRLPLLAQSSLGYFDQLLLNTFAFLLLLNVRIGRELLCPGLLLPRIQEMKWKRTRMEKKGSRAIWDGKMTGKRLKFQNFGNENLINVLLLFVWKMTSKQPRKGGDPRGPPERNNEGYAIIFFDPIPDLKKRNLLMIAHLLLLSLVVAPIRLARCRSNGSTKVPDWMQGSWNSNGSSSTFIRSSTCVAFSVRSRGLW